MENENGQRQNNVEEKEIRPFSGGIMLLLILLWYGISIWGIIGGSIYLSQAKYGLGAFFLIASIVLFIVLCVLLNGFHILNPNEALVMTLFGKYYGTIKKEGFYYTNPFAGAIHPARTVHVNAGINVGTYGTTTAATAPANPVSKKISTKTLTFSNEKQKVNDVLGNPIIIGAVVIWRVADPTKAVFNVDNYKTYLAIQCDSTIRNVARLYPYDTMENDADEKTLRGSSQEIAESMRVELQQRVSEAGLEIKEVRITHLSYAEEIAAAMLQRQQAVAVIAARQKIVEGAVSMVKMAIDQLGQEEIVVLDDERKAAMVSNLLVVLCGNKDAQPIVNSGSIY
ncbi:SPFH domain-containing protein [Anaerocolumna xylanovorans]|uniref:Regulator of protease activity HflC, stomatin/prohibitin superfamily n=1 Tax=Anaerocolumna xylanovorans DSM 12503 TaxID=1121345 RepID=A0A1M7YNK8_9FIRM|nr:SPFH domain-containing protein [Anaerocolumna xylanovorans]SHO54210.1 Regulator of protease activity HflC, stomatin/prohibitin superfamily [Anaerocolumna xylanovorans DSM 12503]